MKWQPMRLVSYEILPGRVLLDVMTDDGEPVAVQLGLSAGLWAVAAVEVIDRWAGDSRQLACVVRCGSQGRRLVLSDGETRMMLDLIAQPGRRLSSGGNARWRRVPAA